jgi:hypothetical protein
MWLYFCPLLFGEPKQVRVHRLAPSVDQPVESAHG